MSALSARVHSIEAKRVNKQKDRAGVLRWFVLAVLVIFAIVMLAPFVIMALNAFKSGTDYSTNGPLSLPKGLYLDGLVSFWNRVNFPEKLFNSLWISSFSAFFAVLLSMLSSFAIGIGRIKGRTWVLALLMIGTMLPQEALVYPLYSMAQQVGLSNSQWSLIIMGSVGHSVFGTYLLSSVLSTFPRPLLEAGAIDGASRWQTLWRIVFPVTRPTLAVLLIFFFIWTWNDFFLPLIMLTTSQTQTIPVALATLQGDRVMDVPTTNAGALISLLPALLFFLIFQRTLTRGLTAGSLK